MPMTGKEAAYSNEAVPGGREKRNAFLVAASARDLQEYVHNIPVDAHSAQYQLARTALDIRLAEDAAKQASSLEQRMLSLLDIAEAQKRLAENLDRQTTTLVGLTRAVKAFTVVLVLLSVGLLFEGGLQLLDSRKSSTHLPQRLQTANETGTQTNHQAVNK